MENPKRSMTREELYKLVWSTPIQKLAAIYGLSDKGLAKTCHRHLIPVPSRGYWARIHAGQAAKRTPLRAVENTALHTVHIGRGKVGGPSPYLLEVLAKAREEIEAENDRLSNGAQTEHPQTAAPVPPMDAGVTSSHQDTPRPEKLKPDVNSFVSQLRRSEVDREGFVRLKWVKVTPKDVSRVGNLLNKLTLNLAPYGFSFNCDGGRVGFTKGEATVDFEIDAPRKKETEVTRFGWKQFTLVHAGRIRLRIYGRAEGIKKEWIDTDTRSLECHIEKIVESFRANHIAEKEWVEQSRRSQERRVHLAMRRKMSKQRAEREEERLGYLQKIADARREAADLRATISLASPDGDVSDDYSRMIEWAQQRLASLEKQTSVDAIQAELNAKQLFTFPDPLYDPEGDPPEKQNYWED
ncbi:hypothetical protein [Agrobacterium sp. lyk4-40-TYG-31]|uniref:hypothetical protein n=1 Tax=Agrobacterium sp. lyk4-40-TYG-31 TaxID=3040276 RepID=UPI00254EC5CC|nr:hypothetical protein [Agrobacterium sp. lyk4-40-TYG-31]